MSYFKCIKFVSNKHVSHWLLSDVQKYIKLIMIKTLPSMQCSVVSFIYLMVCLFGMYRYNIESVKQTCLIAIVSYVWGLSLYHTNISSKPSLSMADTDIIGYRKFVVLCIIHAMDDKRLRPRKIIFAQGLVCWIIFSHRVIK